VTAPLPRRLLAEFLGSAFLACVVIGSGIAAASLSRDAGLQLLGGALAFALIRTLHPDVGPDEAADIVLPHHDRVPA
jgi:hypothetical protein